MSVVALIPARGGSKSIKLKNIKPFCGKPLVAWAIEACLKSGVFDEVWVSTDHDDIARVSEEHGAMVHRRNAHTATDLAKTETVMADFTEAHPGWDVLFLVQATSPLTVAQDFVEALKAFRQNAEADSLITVTRQHRFRWEDAPTTRALNYDPQKRPMRQEWAGELHENGAFYAVTREAWDADGCRLGRQPMPVVQPSYTAYEIDEPYDWPILETIMEKIRARLGAQE